MHFLQRAVNSYMAEVHDTQAASLLLNLNASYTSERFVWVDGWAAVHEGRAALGESGEEWGARGHVPDGMEGAEDESDEDDDGDAEIGGETEWVRQKREAENEDDQSTGRGRKCDVDGNVEVVPMFTHYRLRGLALQRFNYQEYEGCITIVQKTEAQREAFLEQEVAGRATMDEQRRRGRRANRFVRDTFFFSAASCSCCPRVCASSLLPHGTLAV